MSAATNERNALGTAALGALLTLPLSLAVTCGCLVAVVRLRKQAAEMREVFRQLREEIEKEKNREREAAAQNRRRAVATEAVGTENIPLDEFSTDV